MPTQPERMRDANDNGDAEVRRVIEEGLDAWAAGDLEATMRYFSEDVVYTLHLEENAVPLAGETRGKAALRAAFAGTRAAFEYILFRRMPLTINGNRAHNQVEFMFRHYATGELLTGRARFVWTVENSLITRCQEYHDAERISAFMRLFGIGGPGGPAAR